VGGGKAGQHAYRVVADAEDADAVPLEVGQVALQLDQLRLAERSPPGAADEDDQPLAPRTGHVEIDGPAVLVRQHHVGEALPDPRPHAVEVRRGPC
jgi:hypothetical protein